MSKCSIDGCKGHSINSRGWCAAHYARWRRHGSPHGGRAAIGEPSSFLEYAKSFGGDTCLTWPYQRGSSGHGKMHVGGKNVYVTRLICEHVEGPPPSPLHQAAHKCGNAECCNPSHLYWATQSQNEADKIRHETSNRGERHGMSRLTATQVALIRRGAGIVTQAELAEMFGVHQTTISDVQTGRRWSHLGAE